MGDQRAAFRFALRFAAIAAIGFALYCFPYAESGPAASWFGAYLSAYARVAGSMVAWFEPAVTVAGRSIVGRSSIEIVKNCDAMEVLILFGAAVLALGAPIRHSWVALVSGVTTLIALNLARICSLYFVALHWPRAFETIHLEVWPPILVIVATGLFFVCARWLSKVTPERPLAAA